MKTENIYDSDIVLTNPDIISYLLIEKEGDMKKGISIRTKQRCPICSKQFLHVPKLGLICLEHKTVPTRYFVDIFYQGRRTKIYSNKQGKILNNYNDSLNTYGHIQYEIREHTFDPTKYVKADLQKYIFKNVMENWLKFKDNYKYFQYNRDYFKSLYYKDIRDLRSLDIYKCFDELPQGLKNKTKKNIMACLHAFFVYLSRLEVIDKVPVFPEIETIKPKWKWVDVSDQAKILLGIPGKDRPIYLFLALHGCRPQEARALKVKDMDFEHDSITIQRRFTGKSGNILIASTKTEEQRIIPINPDMRAILKDICKDKLPEAFVFINPRTGKPYAKTTYQEIWQRSLSVVGIKIKSYEALRHSWASQRASRGKSIYLIQQILGHSDLRTTQRYTHTNLEALKTVMSIKGKKIEHIKIANCPQTVPRDKQGYKTTNENNNL